MEVCAISCTKQEMKNSKANDALWFSITQIKSTTNLLQVYISVTLSSLVILSGESDGQKIPNEN